MNTDNPFQNDLLCSVLSPGVIEFAHILLTNVIPLIPSVNDEDHDLAYKIRSMFHGLRYRENFQNYYVLACIIIASKFISDNNWICAHDMDLIYPFDLFDVDLLKRIELKVFKLFNWNIAKYYKFEELPYNNDTN